MWGSLRVPFGLLRRVLVSIRSRPGAGVTLGPLGLCCTTCDAPYWPCTIPTLMQHSSLHCAALVLHEYWMGTALGRHWHHLRTA